MKIRSKFDRRSGALWLVLFSCAMWLLPYAATQDDSEQASFTTITLPDAWKAVNTRGRGINAEGDIVGFYRDSANNLHGFLRSSDGDFTAIDVPVEAGNMTEALGINDRGDIVGQYMAAGKMHGFLLSHDGDFTSLPLNSTGTSAHGINDRGDIVGVIDSGLHGFLLSRHGTTTQIDVPLPVVTDTQAYSINDRGVVAGSFSAAGGHGFVRSKDGEFAAPIDFPGTQGATQLFGNNSRGDVVGCYGDSQGVHAWVRTGEDDFTSFDNPEAQQPGAHPKNTVAWGINSQGDIVGEYVSPSDNHFHAFLRSKAQPWGLGDGHDK